VAFDDSLRLSPEYVHRIAPLTDEINQLLNGQRIIGDHIFLAVRLRSGAYTASQYANQGIGYRPMKRIIDYLRVRSEIHDSRANRRVSSMTEAA
jgi:hypothetical protein